MASSIPFSFSTTSAAFLGRLAVLLSVDRLEHRRELLQNAEKAELMLQRRYCEPVFHATRVEFQLRRGKLKELGVQKHFAKWCRPPANLPLAPLRRSAVDAEQLKKQCVGLLIRILVHERRIVDSNDAFVQEAMASLLDETEGRCLSTEFRRRAFELNVPLNAFLQRSEDGPQV